MTKARRIGAKLGLLLVTVCLSLLAAEGLFRWYLADLTEQPGGDDGWRARYRHMNETLYKRSNEAQLVYEPRPNTKVEMEYGPAAFNSAGMRDDREYSQEREAETGERRVVLLGDSLVWGEFLSLEDAPGRQLEAALDPAQQDEHEILNFGVTGYDSTQEARWYEKAARPFRPDILVLVYCMNDMMIMSGPYNRYANDAERRRKEEQDRLFERVAPIRRETLDAFSRREEEIATFLLFARARSLIRRFTFDADYVDEYTIAAADRRRVTATKTALTSLGTTARRDGARALLVISPVLESWDRYHWLELHDLIAETGRTAGFEVVDPLTEWRTVHDPTRMRIPGDNLHYNPRGSALLARAIADAIRRE